MTSVDTDYTYISDKNLVAGMYIETRSEKVYAIKPDRTGKVAITVNHLA